MSNRAAIVERLCDRGIIAVIRAAGSEQLVDVAKALLDGGVDCIEFTMTTPNALEVITACCDSIGQTALIGVGSVLDAATAGRAIQAGAKFVISPVFNPQVIAAGHSADLPVVPGAYTPTEIINATNAGADLVKVFPAGQLGAKYFKAVLAPMPHLRLVPTGGVNLDTASEYIAAGAATLAVGSALVKKTALAEGNLAEIRELAGKFVETVAAARAQLNS